MSKLMSPTLEQVLAFQEVSAPKEAGKVLDLRHITDATPYRCGNDFHCWIVDSKGDVVYASGSASDDLLFILVGEVDFVSDFDVPTTTRRISQSEEIMLASDGEDLIHVDGEGCFGQEVLVGMRRRNTAVAHTNLELLNIETGNLVKLFKDGIASDLRRVCQVLLEEFMARERLRNLGCCWGNILGLVALNENSTAVQEFTSEAAECGVPLQ